MIGVVATGIANTAGVLAGLRRAGADPRLVGAEELAACSHVVLPGVGAFGAGMAALRERELVEPLRARLLAGAPTLGVCLGMQLLARSSEESPGVPGLGVLEADVTALPAQPGLRRPHLGWNHVSAGELVQAGDAYFANGFRFAEPPAGWTVSWTDHGGRFASALQKGAVLACQFHPELSSAWGTDLLRRWLALPGGSPC